jgi:hypothetical protein
MMTPVIVTTLLLLIAFNIWDGYILRRVVRTLNELIAEQERQRQID